MEENDLCSVPLWFGIKTTDLWSAKFYQWINENIVAEHTLHPQNITGINPDAV